MFTIKKATSSNELGGKIRNLNLPVPSPQTREKILNRQQT